MALFDETVNTSIPPVSDEPVPIDTASVYTSRSLSDTIISFIDGSTFVVDYYGQHIADATPITNYNDVIDPTLRQFQKIRKFELRATSSLALTYNETLGTSVLTGEANVYPVIAPRAGDMIVADIGDGVYGLLEVSSVIRLSFFKESAWAIVYHLTEYLNTTNEQELLDKVVNDLVFDVSLLGSPTGPIRTLSENDRAVTLDQHVLEMIEWYFDDFFSERHRTFMVPGLTGTYDPYVVEFWNKFIPSKYILNKPGVTNYDVNNTGLTRDYKTAWDVIGEQSRGALSRVIPKMQIIGTTSLLSTRLQYGLVGNNIIHIVQPFVDSGVADSLPVDDISDLYQPYVFSTAFYENDTANMNDIELLINKMIDRELLNFNEIDLVFNDLKNKTALERFHYIPLLVMLFSVSR